MLIENYKVGTMERWGLGYEEVLRRRNPGLVYASLTGFGRVGPYAARPGYDTIIEAMGGLMSITGEPEGEPVKVGVAIVDIVTGCLAAWGISAALVERERTGRGSARRTRASSIAPLALLTNQASSYLIGGKAPTRHGNGHPTIVPYQTFPTAEGALDGRGRHRRAVRAVLRRPRPAGVSDRPALPHQSPAGRLPARDPWCRCWRRRC